MDPNLAFIVTGAIAAAGFACILARHQRYDFRFIVGAGLVIIGMSTNCYVVASVTKDVIKSICAEGGLGIFFFGVGFVLYLICGGKNKDHRQLGGA